MTNTIVVAYNELPQFTAGWHERFTNPVDGIHYRPTEKHALFTIDKCGQKEILLLVNGSVSLLGGTQTAILKAGDVKIGRIELDRETWVLKRFDVSKLPDGEIEFSIDVDKTFIPHDHLGNGDCRELGIYVAAIRLA